MKRLALLLITNFILTATVMADASISTTEQVVAHHMQSGNDRNVEEVMRDYDDNAILISPDGVYKGKQAIRKSYEQLVAQGSDSIITADRKVFEGEVGYVAWSMNAGQGPAVHGSDTFIVKNGKIVAQTVTIFLPPPVQ